MPAPRSDGQRPSLRGRSRVGDGASIAARIEAGPASASPLLTDLYELTMLRGYAVAGTFDLPAAFEYQFRHLPGGAAFAVFAGLEPLLDRLASLRFSQEELDWLSRSGLFEGSDLGRRLGSFRFRGDVDAAPEGEVVFPREPVLRIEAPLGEAQVVETLVLNALNHPSRVATAAARLRIAAGDGEVVEFGLRRAPPGDAALASSRAAFVGGCDSTSDVLAGRAYDIPLRGTMAHSWVMSFPDELQAFRAWAAAWPDRCLLLLDTYDTLQSGLPHAIQVFRELRDAGRPVRAAVRLDSGDLLHLSTEVDRELRRAGFPDPWIMASGDLDESLVDRLVRAGAPIRAWGVGTRLVTGGDDPAFPGIYKLAAVMGAGGRWEAKAKTTSDPAKATWPGRKEVWRYRDGEGIPLADVVGRAGEGGQEPARAVFHERDDPSRPSRLVGAEAAAPLLVPVMRGGVRVGPREPEVRIRARAMARIARLPPVLRALSGAPEYPVGLSPGLAREVLLGAWVARPDRGGPGDVGVEPEES